MKNLLSYIKYKKQIENNKIKFDDSYFILVIFILIVLINAIQNKFIPFDDLLRDLIVYKYNYDYKNMYINYGLMTPYNQYIAFDIVAGKLFSMFNYASILIFQWSAIILYFCALLNFWKIEFKNYQYQKILITIFFTLSINVFTFGRALIARPEIFLVIWFLFSYQLRNAYLTILWCIIGLLLIPSYWLSIIYLPAIFLLARSNKFRISLFIIYFILAIIFWQYYSSGLWIKTFELTKHQLHNRLIPITENDTILSVLNSFTQIYLTIIFLIYVSLNNLPTLKILVKNNKLLICLFGFYLYPNMLRYCDIVIPLYLLLIAKLFLMQNYSIDILFKKNNVIFYFFPILIFAGMINIRNTDEIVKFNIPRDSKVLVSMNGQYSIQFYNKELIHVVPNMEIGSVDRKVQQTLINISQGTVSCQELKAFDYLAENKLIQIPNCLKLEEVYKSWRLWKVTN